MRNARIALQDSENARTWHTKSRECEIVHGKTDMRLQRTEFRQRSADWLLCGVAGAWVRMCACVDYSVYGIHYDEENVLLPQRTRTMNYQHIQSHNYHLPNRSNLVWIHRIVCSAAANAGPNSPMSQCFLCVNGSNKDLPHWYQPCTSLHMVRIPKPKIEHDPPFSFFNCLQLWKMIRIFGQNSLDLKKCCLSNGIQCRKGSKTRACKSINPIQLSNPHGKFRSK